MQPARLSRIAALMLPARARARPARKLAKTLAGASVVVLLVLPASIASAQDPAQVQARLESMRLEITAITERLSREREQKAAEQAALAETERELGRLARRLRETRAELDRTRASRQRALDRARAVEDDIEGRRDELAEQLAIAYRIGARSRMRTLLSNDDAADVSRLLAMHGYLGRARLEAVENLQRRRNDLEAVLDEQRRIEARLASLVRKQAVVVADRNRALKRRLQVLDDLEKTIQSREDRLSSLRTSVAELESLLEQLAGALADIPPGASIVPFSELRGALPMPLAAPVRAGFADRRNGDVTWEGWLIEAEVGEPVSAVANGRVAYADWLRGYGMMLIIDHGDGFMSLYGRNQSLLAEVGDWVAPGDVIALAGNSGGGSEPGLYFQLRHDGRPVDPAGWINR